MQLPASGGNEVCESYRPTVELILSETAASAPVALRKNSVIVALVLCLVEPIFSDGRTMQRLEKRALSLQPIPYPPCALTGYYALSAICYTPGVGPWPAKPQAFSTGTVTFATLGPRAPGGGRGHLFSFAGQLRMMDTGCVSACLTSVLIRNRWPSRLTSKTN